VVFRRLTAVQQSIPANTQCDRQKHPAGTHTTTFKPLTPFNAGNNALSQRPNPLHDTP
jgi:hypothetical protein